MYSRATARIVAVTALLGTIGALAFVLARAPEDRATAGPRLELSALGPPAEDLAAQLSRMRVGRSARPAQRAVKRVLAVQAKLAARAGNDRADERAVNALEREAEYLDALGSVLSNPRSPLAKELAERGRRARAALAAAPGGAAAAAATRGWERVLARARARRR